MLKQMKIFIKNIKEKKNNINKRKAKKSDYHTNIDKYRVAANITEYHIKINLPDNHHSKIHDIKAIISCKKLTLIIEKLCF